MLEAIGILMMVCALILFGFALWLALSKERIETKESRAADDKIKE